MVCGLDDVPLTNAAGNGLARQAAKRHLIIAGTETDSYQVAETVACGKSCEADKDPWVPSVGHL